MTDTAAGTLGQLSGATKAALQEAGLDPAAVAQVVHSAASEDLAFGPDVTTTATVPAGAIARGVVAARAAGILAGLPVAHAVLDIIGGNRLSITRTGRDGDAVRPGDVALHVAGQARALLIAERSMLNLLCHLSGIATLTGQWVQAVAGTGAIIRDTRKTTPGLRALEKYAVRCGGGQNHRMALGDQALIKDNHVAAAGSIRAAFAAVRRDRPDIDLEIECDTVAQVREAIAAGAVLVLLDNMNLAELREAVAIAEASGGTRLEASGGLTLSSARAVAETGVHFLAVGALTHSAPALDFGLDLLP